MPKKVIKLPPARPRRRETQSESADVSEGRCASSMEVLPTAGVGRVPYAGRCAVMAGEDADAYGALVERLMARFMPEDEVEAHLVRRLASIMWRTDRAEQLEADLFSASDRESWRGNRRVHIRFDAERLNAMMRYQRVLESGLLRTLTALSVLQSKKMQNEPGNVDFRDESII